MNGTYFEFECSVDKRIHPEWDIQFHSNHCKAETKITSMNGHCVALSSINTSLLHRPAGLIVTWSIVMSTALLTKIPMSATHSLSSAANWEETREARVNVGWQYHSFFFSPFIYVLADEKMLTIVAIIHCTGPVTITYASREQSMQLIHELSQWSVAKSMATLHWH